MRRIDDLVAKSLLTKGQADLLHESRYLGNAALHEVEAPQPEDLEAVLEIVESLMKTIYVYPAKALELQAKRESARNPAVAEPGKSE